MALVPGALAVLADANLRAALVRQHLGRDGTVSEEHLGRERPALVGLDPVHDQILALTDAVLLAAQTDDCVFHQHECSQAEAREAVASVATAALTRPTPTGSSGCSPSHRRHSRTPPARERPARAYPRLRGPRPRGPRPPPCQSRARRSRRPRRPHRPASCGGSCPRGSRGASSCGRSGAVAVVPLPGPVEGPVRDVDHRAGRSRPGRRLRRRLGASASASAPN